MKEKELKGIMLEMEQRKRNDTLFLSELSSCEVEKKIAEKFRSREGKTLWRRWPRSYAT
jgi:hypothetical protein